MRLLILVLSAPLALIACSAGGGSPSPASPTPSPSGLDAGPVPIELFNRIVADAAAQAGVDPSALTVVAASSVVWSDGSLGCPAPGMFYTQALVPGYRVVLETAGVQYDYHASQRGTFNLCPPGRARPPVGGDQQ